MRVAYLAGATDFHAMDWIKSCLKVNPEKRVYLLTDLIGSQGLDFLIDDRLSVIKLVVIDKLLLKNESFIAHKLRNFIKFLLLPIQALLVYRFSKKYPNLIFHAHSMYYLVVARMAGVKYIGTPVGSDILLKPFTSKFFYFFANYGIKNAIHITVDSNAMLELLISKFDFRKSVSVIQNGIDYETISNCRFDKIKDSGVNYIYSIRGLAPIYQIEKLFLARNQTIPQIPIFFSYPFSEIDYVEKIKELYSPNDIDLGKIGKIELYNKMNQSLLVVSIPYSDSSPRSVYEAIFCGAIVAVTKSKYLEQLPICMLDRLILIDLNDTNWLSDACNKAFKLRSIPFEPSEEAILMFDQYNSYKTLEKIYAKFIV